LISGTLEVESSIDISPVILGLTICAASSGKSAMADSRKRIW
jgi:hypothetical protein